MADKNKQSLIELWPSLKDDMSKFISDRPGWFIETLEKARNKKGSRGWKDVETLIDILQFLRDTQVEY